MKILDFNMSYKNLNTLVTHFQNKDSEFKHESPIFDFNDLPKIISLGGMKVGENTYASVDYFTDNEDDADPISEAYLTLSVSEDLPEEKSRSVILDAQWIFKPNGITQTRGEPLDLMVFFEMIP